MDKDKLDELRRRVSAQLPPPTEALIRDDAPFSTYVRYGKRMIEYVAASHDLDTAFLLAHEELRVKKVRKHRVINLVEWRLENVTDRHWSEPPSQYRGPWLAVVKQKARQSLVDRKLPGGEIRPDGTVLLFGDGLDHRYL